MWERMFLILFLIADISARVRETMYEKQHFSDVTRLISFELGSNKDPRANERSCAMQCSMHEHCHFFAAVQSNHCFFVSFGQLIGQSVPFDYYIPETLYGKTDHCLAGSCYFTIGQGHRWGEAKQICKDRGAYLAEVHSETQLALVNAIAVADIVDGIAWLGGTDWGEWRWNTSGNPFTITNWLPGEPGNNEERCLAMQLNHNGGWNNRPCWHPGAAICWLH